MEAPMKSYTRAWWIRQVENHILAVVIAVLMAIVKGVHLTWHDVWLLIAAEALIQARQLQSALDLKAPSLIDPWKNQ